VRFARPLVAACALALATPALAAGQEGAAPFTNPVIPGNVADPSVVRADGAYWAASTSGGWAPVFPIFRSTDLVHWHQVGAVFDRPPAWARGNFWAPGLAVRRGVWSVYYSASRRGGKPCVAVAQASRPTGLWRDRGFVVCQRAGSIDPAAVTDAAGRRYLVWKRMGAGSGIYGARLSSSGRRLVSPPVELVLPNTEWEQGVTEGPDVVRNGDRYVLVYSGGHCCRPPCTYAVGVARAKRVLGPYFKDPANPVFRGGNGWKCPGHGTLVRAPAGALAFLHHAYRFDDALDIHRQALLDPVAWGDDGWPVFGAGGVPVGAGPSPDAVALEERFRAGGLDPGWEWPYNGPPRLRVARGVLRIARGSLSRAWAPRDFTVQAAVAGAGDVAVVLTGGRSIAVRASRGGVVLASGRLVVARARTRRIVGLRLNVRAGGAVAAYYRPPRHGWRRVGPPVLAPAGSAVDRVALGPGAYRDVSVSPL
jgi:xylan 1,4-beta-xylosidase